MTTFDGRDLHRTLCEALEIDPHRRSAAQHVRWWLGELSHGRLRISPTLYARVTGARASLASDLGFAVLWCATAGVDVHVHCDRGVTFLVHYDSGLTEALQRPRA